MNQPTKNEKATPTTIHQELNLYATASRIGYIPIYHLQTVAIRIHLLPLLLLLEIRPYMNLVGNYRNGLQKGWFFRFVKYKNISSIP
jgi:hypothetical protein